MPLAFMPRQRHLPPDNRLILARQEGTRQTVVRLAEGVEDESGIHIVVLRFKVEALRQLGY